MLGSLDDKPLWALLASKYFHFPLLLNINYFVIILYLYAIITGKLFEFVDDLQTHDTWLIFYSFSIPFLMLLLPLLSSSFPGCHSQLQQIPSHAAHYCIRKSVHTKQLGRQETESPKYCTCHLFAWHWSSETPFVGSSPSSTASCLRDDLECQECLHHISLFKLWPYLLFQLGQSFHLWVLLKYRAVRFLPWLSSDH